MSYTGLLPPHPLLSSPLREHTCLAPPPAPCPTAPPPTVDAGSTRSPCGAAASLPLPRARAGRAAPLPAASEASAPGAPAACHRSPPSSERAARLRAPLAPAEEAPAPPELQRARATGFVAPPPEPALPHAAGLPPTRPGPRFASAPSTAHAARAPLRRPPPALLPAALRSSSTGGRALPSLCCAGGLAPPSPSSARGRDPPALPELRRRTCSARARGEQRFAGRRSTLPCREATELTGANWFDDFGGASSIRI